MNLTTLKKPVAAVLIVCFLWATGGLILDNSFLSGNTHPELSGLAPNLSDNQVAGTKVGWTATAYDPDNDELLYRFLLSGPSTNHAWKNLTDWIRFNSWTWNTTKYDIGENQIKVQIRDGKHSGILGFDAEQNLSFTIIGLLPVIRSLTPSRPSPQFAGTALSWKADAYDPLEREIYYRFSINGPLTNGQRDFMTDWITDNRWIWKTKPSDKGSYQIYVEIRSENSIEPEAYKAVSFELTNPPPQPPRLQPDKMSPQKVGTSIRWAAESSDPNGDTIYYRFLLSGPSTDFDWKVVNDWSTNNTWTWVPSALSVGDNTIKVQVRDVDHGDDEKFDVESKSGFSIIDPQPKQANLSPQSPIQKPIDYKTTEESRQPSAESNQSEIKDKQEIDHPTIESHHPTQSIAESFNANNLENKTDPIKPIRVGGDKKHNRTLYVGEVNKPRSQ